MTDVEQLQAEIERLRTEVETSDTNLAAAMSAVAELEARAERLQADLDRAIVELAGPEPTDGSAYYWACRVNGARRKAEASAERLVAALRKYGQHDDTCELKTEWPFICTCGLTATLAQEGRTSTPFDSE